MMRFQFETSNRLQARTFSVNLSKLMIWAKKNFKLSRRLIAFGIDGKKIIIFENSSDLCVNVFEQSPQYNRHCMHFFRWFYSFHFVR